MSKGHFKREGVKRLNVTCERANGTSFACWASESEDILIRTVVWTRPIYIYIVEWTEGLNKLAYEGLCEGMNLRCKDWLNAVYDKWRNSKKEGTEGEWLRMKWALAMQRRANEWCDWRWNTPEGEWVTKRTDGLKIKTQSLCFHMKDGRSDTFRFVKRSETKRLFVNETSHKDT